MDSSDTWKMIRFFLFGEIKFSQVHVVLKLTLIVLLRVLLYVRN